MPTPMSRAATAQKVALSLAFFSCLFQSQAAFAQGKVVKQKSCKIQVDGLPKGAVGQSVVITISDGKKVNGKITVYKAPRALVEVEATQCALNLVGATIEGGGKAAAKGAKGTKGSDTPSTDTASTNAKFGITSTLGWGSTTVKRPEGSSVSLPYGGLEMGGGGRYYLNLNPKMVVPFEVGAVRFSNSVKVQSVDETNVTRNYTITFTSLLMRAAGGFGYYVMPQLRTMALLNFDYGLSSNLTYSGDHGRDTPVRKLKSVMRYGMVAGLDYAVFKGLKLGADGTFFLGNIAEAALDPTLTASSFSIMGFGALLRIGYDF